MELTSWEMALRLSIALVAAAVIGWEREVKDRPAGLRTHILVGLGACVFTLLALDLYHGQIQLRPNSALDPQKVIAGIVGGVGFLGAGAILQSRGKIRGLTTAAGIWVVAAIGVAAGCGNYAVVALTVGFTFVTLFALGKIETRGLDRGSAEPKRNT